MKRPFPFRWATVAAGGLAVVLLGAACGVKHDIARQYGAALATPAATLEEPPPPRAASQERIKAGRPSRSRLMSPPVTTLPPSVRELGYGWPVGRGKKDITSGFGHRVDPIHGGARFHHGLDIGCWTGQSVAATNAGSVVWAGRARVYGNAAVVAHEYGVMSIYGHLQSVTVSVGDSVTAGQQVGRCGSTGRSTGPHLHFEIRYGGRVYDPLFFLP